MVIDIFSIISMLFIFWLADFVFQNDEDAINKSKSNKALFNHTVKHSLIMLCGMFVLITVGLLESKHWWSLGTFTLVNLVTHTAIDYITSRIYSKYWKEQKRHNFFAAIGLDQWIHYAIMFGSAVWLFTFKLV